MKVEVCAGRLLPKAAEMSNEKGDEILNSYMGIIWGL